MRDFDDVFLKLPSPGVEEEGKNPRLRSNITAALHRLPDEVQEFVAQHVQFVGVYRGRLIPPHSEKYVIVLASRSRLATGDLYTLKEIIWTEIARAWANFQHLSERDAVRLSGEWMGRANR